MTIAVVLVVIIEVLFSPILNSLLDLFKGGEYVFRDTILFNSDVSIIYLNFVFFLEILGAFYAGVKLIKFASKERNISKRIVGVILCLVAISGIVSLIFVNVFSSIGF